MEEIARVATGNRVIGGEREGEGFRKVEQEVS